LGGIVEFRQTLLSFPIAQLKKIAKPHLTQDDFKAARTKEALTAALWDTVQASIKDQVPNSR
jgi:hypothetical protein